jgi:hypothetical protein
MKLMSIAGVMAAAAIAAATGSASLHAAEEKVTLTGCAVKGNGDGDGFLLANAVERTTRTTTTPGAEGSTVASTTTNEMKPARILYWLDDDHHAVGKLMGQLVEVTGEVEGDVKKGEIKAERENGMIELEIKVDGHKANVKLPDVPSAIGTAGSVKDHEVELPYTVRKLDVKSAKSIGSTCQ